MLFLQKYLYSPSEETFVAVPAMPAQLPGQIRRVLDTLHSIDQGKLCQLFSAAMLTSLLLHVLTWTPNKAMQSFTMPA